MHLKGGWRKLKCMDPYHFVCESELGNTSTANKIEENGHKLDVINQPTTENLGEISPKLVTKPQTQETS